MSNSARYGAAKRLDPVRAVSVRFLLPRRRNLAVLPNIFSTLYFFVTFVAFVVKLAADNPLPLFNGNAENGKA